MDDGVDSLDGLVECAWLLRMSVNVAVARDTNGPYLGDVFYRHELETVAVGRESFCDRGSFVERTHGASDREPLLKELFRDPACDEPVDPSDEDLAFSDGWHVVHVSVDCWGHDDLQKLPL